MSPRPETAGRLDPAASRLIAARVYQHNRRRDQRAHYTDTARRYLDAMRATAAKGAA